MADVTIWRLILGNSDDTCNFDMDVEILQKDTPNTRHRRQLLLDRKIHSLVLIFSHKTSLEIGYFILRETTQKNDLNDLETLCLTAHNKVEHRVGQFSLKKRLEKRWLTMHTSHGEYTSRLEEDGIERIVAAIRVKKHMSRYARYHMLDGEEDETDFPRHKIRERELRFACYQFTLKYAIDFLKYGKEVFPKRMPQEEFRALCRNLFDGDFRKAYKTDFAMFKSLVEDTVGFKLGTTPGVMKAFLDASAHSAWNPYNEPIGDMSEDQLLVMGIWQLQMG